MTQELATRRLTTGAFTREAVEALSQRNNEPQWLRDRRLAAWELADRLPFPTGYERAWKYLNPDRLRVDAHTLDSSAPTFPALSQQTRDAGAVLTTLDSAVRDHPELVQKHLGAVVPADESVFVALNSALWSGGVFAYVPKDVKVELPLQAMLKAAGDQVGVLPRVLIVLDRGAEAVIVDHHDGGDGPLFANAVTEIVLGDEARLQHFGIQDWGAGAQELFFQRATLGRNAHLVTTMVGLGGSIHKGWIESQIKGTGANSEILGVVFGTGDQYFDVITLQDHIGDHSVSDLLIKSALKDSSQSAYYGLTRINRSARMSDANQEDRNLLLSDRAKAEADPVLEILTSEVARCAHGASAGPVDQEQLFYLECRGLPRPEAEKLLVQGFLGQVIERIPVEGVRQTIEAAVLAKLG